MARVLSERGYETLQEMVAWWQRNKNNLPSPQRRRNITVDSGRRTRIAYCKADAGTGNTIVCYLDTDHTGVEVTVYCNIAQGGLDLNEAEPRLINGNPMLVEYVWDGTNNYWRCPSIFQPTLDCDCYEE